MHYKKSSYNIPYIQYLDAEGVPIKELPQWTEDHTTLKSYYRTLVISRQADQKAIALQRTGKMGTYPSVLGQEVISTVSVSFLKETDVLVPYYRDLPGLMVRGIPISDVYLYWGGDERGSSGPQWRKDFPNCVPIATQTTHAAGIATAFKIRNQANVVLCFLGDGATSKGDFAEALNIAGIWQLPVIFIINNNQWAISVPRSIQTAAFTLAQKSISAGLPAIQVDGNDVIALHEATATAIKRARDGKGATVIEAISYRLSDHTTADDADRYRNSEALKQAWKKDPIKRLRNYLIKQNLWDEKQELDLTKEATSIVTESVNRYLNTPLPDINDLFDYQYASLPASLKEQKTQAIMRAKYQHE